MRAARTRYNTEGGFEVGDEFAAEVDRVIERILRLPKIGHVWPGEAGRHGVRRALLQRFPFALAYFVYDEQVVVVAIAHFSRAPDFWLRRIKSK